MTTRVHNVPAQCRAGHVLEPRTWLATTGECVICIRIEQFRAHYHPNVRPDSPAGRSGMSADVIPAYLLDPKQYSVGMSLARSREVHFQRNCMHCSQSTHSPEAD